MYYVVVICEYMYLTGRIWFYVHMRGIYIHAHEKDEK